MNLTCPAFPKAMNYFAHALPFLDGDDDVMTVGTGIPDWLSVVDRRCRVRAKHATAFLEDSDRLVASVARGALQHVRDDARFHQSRAFVELSLGLSRRVREYLGESFEQEEFEQEEFEESEDRKGVSRLRSGFRPAFLAHLLVEVLLDARLIAQHPERLSQYYAVVGSVDPEAIQAAVNRMVARPTDRLAGLIRGFCELGILWDYLEDEKLMVRLNQVLRRVGFDPVPTSFVGFLPEARRRVDERAESLLADIPVRQPKPV